MISLFYMKTVFHCFYKNHFPFCIYYGWIGYIVPILNVKKTKVGCVGNLTEKLTQNFSQFYILFFKPYEIKDTEGKKTKITGKEKLSLWQCSSPFSTVVEALPWEVSTRGNCYKLVDTPGRTSPPGPTPHPCQSKTPEKYAL